jgi:hypothetical protein
MGTDISNEQVFVSALTYSLLSDELKQRLQEDVETDSEYQNVIRAYEQGWPEERKIELGEYWTHKRDTFAEDGLLYWRNRPVIPEKARERLLQSIHRGHVGIRASLRRAERVWWPQIKTDVKNYIKSCHTCQSNSDQQRAEPMLSFEIPTAPGIAIASDFFDCEKDQYVLFTDLFSGWTEFFQVKTKDSKNLIRSLRSFMIRNGIPRVFHSDRGSAYTGNEFEKFCKDMSIRRTDASAKHERGNAHAEAAVKRVKKWLMRCRSEDELMKASLAWHQTPIMPGRPSPAQIHLGRNIRDELHWTVEKANISWEDVRSWKSKMNDEAKKYFDRGTRELEPLHDNQDVFVFTKGEWKEGKVLRKLERPRSYQVELKDGAILERNRVKLKPNRTEHSANPKRPVTLKLALPFQERREQAGRRDTEPWPWTVELREPDEHAEPADIAAVRSPARDVPAEPEPAADVAPSPVSVGDAGVDTRNDERHDQETGERPETDQDHEYNTRRESSTPEPLPQLARRKIKKLKRLIEEI